jgi:hypothetical protein
VSAVQVALHTAPAQMRPLHDVVTAVGHEPIPSQLTAAVAVPAAQVAVAHDVVLGVKTHDMLVPSQ